MRVLIVDDEPPARDRLRQLLEEDGVHEVVGEAGNGREALELAARTAPDVVLLDIRMPGMDGIETAHHLNTAENAPAVVFTTAYDEYAIDAFDANAIGYVLKPVRRERLVQALKQAARLTGEALGDIGRRSGAPARRHLCSRLHDELKLIPVDDVLYFVADQKYVTVVHEGGRDLIEDSLKSLETEFDERFVRIHRSAVVALAAIDTLRKDEEGRTRVILRDIDNGDDLVVSRRHVADVKRRLRKG
ncbi:MAG: LytTR family DNA-binding domain-containing protein [Gammaproteobacteria bacterium]|nr:LytTR family DNA-binding domain-containing protein [Gammaproteobacteria bacterium]MDH5346076.1 LytTR family DNA-binding domain-containing protein [Gammaproteobacteria bacterium]